MKYTRYQNIAFIFLLISFICFLIHFFNGKNYLFDIIIMAISFIAIGICSFLNSTYSDSSRMGIILNEEEKLKHQALINIEKKIIEMGKQKTITYLEKSEMLEKEIADLRSNKI